MTTDTQNTIEQKKLFEVILWQIDRTDSMRSATSNRAAMVLSAGAILLAADTFLLDKALSGSINYTLFEKIVLAFGIGSSIVLVTFSIFKAITGIVNVWRTSRAMLGKYSTEMPKRIFFHSRDTISEFSDFKSFENAFQSSSYDQFIMNSLGELWTLTFTHHDRYQKLRKSIQFLVFSLFPLLLALIVLLIHLF